MYTVYSDLVPTGDEFKYAKYRLMAKLGSHTGPFLNLTQNIYSSKERYMEVEDNAEVNQFPTMQYLSFMHDVFLVKIKQTFQFKIIYALITKWSKPKQ